MHCKVLIPLAVSDNSACPLRVLTSLGVNEQGRASHQKEHNTPKGRSRISILCQTMWKKISDFLKVSTLTALMYSVLRTEGLVGKRVFNVLVTGLSQSVFFYEYRVLK